MKDTHPIYWAHISMLMADIKCLDLLLKSDFSRLYQWQYFINQPATALPTMKVDEIADMLNQHRGHCDSIVYTPHKLCPKDSIYSIRNSSFDDRFHYKFQLRYKSFLIRISNRLNGWIFFELKGYQYLSIASHTFFCPKVFANWAR